MAERGFSLIEVIIALAIILSTVLIYAGSLATVRLVRDVRDQIQAYRIAARQMEVLRSTDFAALPGSGSFNDPDFSKLPSGSGTLSITSYNGSAHFKQVGVTVNWSDDGLSRQVQLNTLMGETGFNP